jgi:hypothetical protein
MQMGIYMKVNGLMIKLMDLGSIIISMGVSMKVIGLKINNKVLVKRFGQMEHNSKVIT